MSKFRAELFDGKKFMWDAIEYESKEKAQEAMDKYKADGFEVEMIEEDGKFLVFSRRVVTEIVLEGPPPV